MKTYEQIKVIEAKTPTELAEKFNEMMREIPSKHEKPVISMETLTAYVVYTETEVVEEKHSESFNCSDCKHFHEGRRPNGTSDCPYRHGDNYGWDKVCKEFWDAYEAKEDILYVPRNKDGSVNKTTTAGKRYLKLKERGIV